MKFKLGDKVRKIKGSEWSGTVVGTYSTDLTPEGYGVESDKHKGSVQIYPASALEIITATQPTQHELAAAREIIKMEDDPLGPLDVGGIATIIAKHRNPDVSCHTTDDGICIAETCDTCKQPWNPSLVESGTCIFCIQKHTAEERDNNRRAASDNADWFDSLVNDLSKIVECDKRPSDVISKVRELQRKAKALEWLESGYHSTEFWFSLQGEYNLLEAIESAMNVEGK